MWYLPDEYKDQVIYVTKEEAEEELKHYPFLYWHYLQHKEDGSGG